MLFLSFMCLSLDVTRYFNMLNFRCAALFMSVRHLVMICQGHCKKADVIEWIYRSLYDVEQNLKVSV